MIHSGPSSSNTFCLFSAARSWRVPMLIAGSRRLKIRKLAETQGAVRPLVSQRSGSVHWAQWRRICPCMSQCNSPRKHHVLLECHCKAESAMPGCNTLAITAQFRDMNCAVVPTLEDSQIAIHVAKRLHAPMRMRMHLHGPLLMRFNALNIAFLPSFTSPTNLPCAADHSQGCPWRRSAMCQIL